MYSFFQFYEFIKAELVCYQGWSVGQGGTGSKQQTVRNIQNLKQKSLLILIQPGGPYLKS